MAILLSEILDNPKLPEEERRDIEIVYSRIQKLQRATSRQITEGMSAIFGTFPTYSLRMENALYVLEQAELIKRDRTTGQYLPV